MARKGRKGKYQGVLSTPIYLPDRDDHAKAEGLPIRIATKLNSGESALLRKELEIRIPALLNHFNLKGDEQDVFLRLALCLAKEHVPGFHVVREQGAPNKITASMLGRLYRYFNRAKSKWRSQTNARSISTARLCQWILNDQKFKSSFPELKNTSLKRLQNIISQSKKLRRERIRAVLLKRRNSRTDSDEAGSIPSGLGDLPAWFYGKPLKWK